MLRDLDPKIESEVHDPIGKLQFVIVSMQFAGGLFEMFARFTLKAVGNIAAFFQLTPRSRLFE
jgi:hypothetical protein